MQNEVLERVVGEGRLAEGTEENYDEVKVWLKMRMKENNLRYGRLLSHL